MTPLPLVDSHAHLTSKRFESDLAEVLQRAREAGVVQVLTLGTTAEDSRESIALARRFVGVFAGVAIHPNDVAEAASGDWEHIVELSSDPSVVAIGETGLDRYWDRTPFALQQESFDRHLDLAAETHKPVVIHCRDCMPDILEQLQRRGGPIDGVLHSFTGTWDEAQALLDLGLHVSFAGMITFENRSLDSLRDVAARVPADRLLVETDSPYLTPHPFRGKRNEPARVALTATRIAELRGLPPAELAAQTSENARRLFRLPSP